MSAKGKIITAVVVAVLLIAAAIYGFTYNFLSKISVEEGAEGYPVPEKRVNVVVMGVANGLADTIMLASFDPEDGALDVLSIPRDTYIERKGHKTSANNKINSSYGRGGADNVVKSVASLTGMDVHYFVEVDYEAVKELVDAMGGIKVTVPVSYTHLRAHETPEHIVCRLLLEKKKAAARREVRWSKELRMTDKRANNK